MAANAVEVVVRLVDHLSGPARQAASALRKISDAARAVNGRVTAATQAATSALRAQRAEIDKTVATMRRGASMVGRGALTTGIAAGTAYVARLGGALAFVKTQLLGTAIEFENYQVTLEAMSRSADKAKILTNWASGFATKTPYEINEVVEALAKLSAYGVINPKATDAKGLEQISSVMSAIGDASSLMGKSYMQGVEAIADAMTGQMERLKEAFGIVGSKKGDKVTLEYLDLVDDKTKKVTLSMKDRAKIVRAIVAILNRNYGGGMEKKSGTIGGMLSNLSDAWTRFKQAILEAGVGKELKTQLGNALKWVDEFTRKPVINMARGVKFLGESQAEIWAARVSDELVKAMRQAKDIAIELVGAIKQVHATLDAFANSGIGKALGGWKTIIGGLIALPIAPALAQIGAGLTIMAWAGVKLAVALTPVAVAIGSVLAALGAPTLGALAAAGYAVSAYVRRWETVRAALRRIWSGFKSQIAGIGNVLRGIFTFNPKRIVAGVVQAISGIAGVLSGLGEMLLIPFRQAFADLDALLGGRLSAIAERIRSAFAGINLFDIGAQIIQSLWDGITSKINALLGYISGIGARIRGAISGAIGGTFGVPSPAAPQAQPQSAPGGAAPVAPIQRSSQVSAPMNVTINVTGGGQDAPKLARTIASHIARLDRRFNDGIGGEVMV